MQAFKSRLKWLPTLLAVLAVLAIPLAMSVPAVADGEDYSMPGGWFFTQTGGGGGKGFAVRDAGTDASGKPTMFWREFQRLGGVATLGYPIGQPYVGSDGFTYQPFQRAVLQWRPELSLALLSNTFEQLQTAGRDDWLWLVRGIPRPIANDGSGGDFNKAVATRLGWLTNSAISAKFYLNPNSAAIQSWSVNDSIQLYGLPMSQPEKNGPFISQRFQRVSFQAWTDSVPGMPAPGTVVGVLGGDLLKEAGLIPSAATAPLGPGGTPIATATPTTTPTPRPPTPTPTPSFAYTQTRSWGYPNCGTTYMKVFVKDSSGNGIDDVGVKSWNDYGNEYTENTANGGIAGRVFGGGAVAGKWYTQIVDASGNAASATSTQLYTDNCHPEDGPAVQQVELEYLRN